MQFQAQAGITHNKNLTTCWPIIIYKKNVKRLSSSFMMEFHFQSSNVTSRTMFDKKGQSKLASKYINLSHEILPIGYFSNTEIICL